MPFVFVDILSIINSFVLKADGEGVKIPDGPPPPQLSALGASIDRAFHLALYFVIPIGIGMAIVGAIMWIMARDDAEKLKKAQMTLTWAVVGTIFLVFVGGLMNLIVNKVFKGASLTLEAEYLPQDVYTSGIGSDALDLLRKDIFYVGIDWLDQCDKGKLKKEVCDNKMGAIYNGTESVDENACYNVASISSVKRHASHEYYQRYFDVCVSKFNKDYYYDEFKTVFADKNKNPGKYKSLLDLCHRLYNAGWFGITRDYNLNAIDDARWAACQEVFKKGEYKK